jgi:hypothetical protein
MGAGNEFTSDVSDYFTKLIYDLVGLRKMDEITID